MRINTSEKEKCCGCSTCSLRCPRHAIKMKKDELGFLYPEIDDTKCTNCGLCYKICPFNSPQTNYSSLPIVYAARSKNQVDLEKSQSGGLAFLFSSYFLQQGGIVYGAELSADQGVHHIRVSKEGDLNKLRGTKYAQSDIAGIFSMIKKDLSTDNIVLFIGTPCQVAGLKSYLHNDISHLYTIDLVCHGVGSPTIWNEYLHYLSKKFKGKITKANFRDKQFGWTTARESYLIGKETISRRTYLDLYLKGFIQRESCYKCLFTNMNRVGDITLGDFWGWTNHHKDFDDDKGISLVLINSQKGESLYNKINKLCNYIESNVDDCLQPQLQYPTEKNIKRDDFIRNFTERGFEYVGYKYGDMSISYKIHQKLSAIKTFLTKWQR